jgi:hypothetical protein
MHTLGHPSGGGHHDADPKPVPGVAPEPHAVPHTAAAGIVAAAGWGTRLDPSTVCLAIVATGLLVWLLTTLPRAGRPTRLDSQSRRAVGGFGRGPPTPAGFDCRLADLSVVRI